MPALSGRTTQALAKESKDSSLRSE